MTTCAIFQGAFVSKAVRVKPKYLLGATVLAACIYAGCLIAQATTVVEGRVVEAGSNMPIEGARVSTSSGTAFALSNGEGRFVLSGVSSGRMRIFPQKNGLVYSRPNSLYPREPGVWIEVASGDRLQNLELRMVKEAAVSGRIVDSLGQSVPTAAVTLLVRSFDETGRPTLARAPGTPYNFAMVRTNDKGEFRLSGLQPGDYYLRVDPGLGPTPGALYPGVRDESRAAPIVLKGGEEFQVNTIALNREKTADLHLRFKDAAELPRTRLVTIAPDRSLVFPATRDELVIPGVRVGDYRLLVSWVFSPSEIIYGFAELHVAGTDISHALTTSQAVRISTQIILEDQAGKRTLQNRVRCSLQAELPLISANCSGGVIPGRYSLELQDVPSDAYVVSAEASGQDVLNAGLEVKGDISMNVLLRTPGGTLEGTVVNSKNEKVADAVVAIIPNPAGASSRAYRSTISDVNGRFRIQGIPPGQYAAFAWPDLPENAYRNAAFMKDFQDHGESVQVANGQKATRELKLLQVITN